jgi:hypothetical protein
MLYFPIIDRVEILSIDAAETSSAAPNPSNVRNRQRNRTPQLGASDCSPSSHSRGCSISLALLPIRRALAARSVGRFYQCRVGRSDYVLALGDLEGSERSPHDDAGHGAGNPVRAGDCGDRRSARLFREDEEIPVDARPHPMFLPQRSVAEPRVRTRRLLARVLAISEIGRRVRRNPRVDEAVSVPFPLGQGNPSRSRLHQRAVCEVGGFREVTAELGSARCLSQPVCGVVLFRADAPEHPTVPS